MQSRENSKTSQTTLDPLLDSEPWDAMMFGDGVDAVTGYRMPSAVKPFTVDVPQSMTVVSTFHLIQSDDEFSSAMSAEVGASYNVGNVHLNASAAFEQASSFSETSLSLLAVCKVVSEEAPKPAEVELTDAAAALLKDYASSFRDYFGDYYVKSAHFGAAIYVVYSCTTSSKESMSAFRSSIEGSTDVFSTAGAASFKDLSKRHDVQLSISWHLEGTKIPPPNVTPDIDGVLNLINWFHGGQSGGHFSDFEHLNFVPLSAQLEHYWKLLAGAVPRTVDIDPQVFLRMQRLRVRMLSLTSRANELPEYYLQQKLPDGTELGVAVSEARSTYDGLAPMLATLPDELGALEARVADLQAAVDPAVKMVTFFQGVVAEQADEPRAENFTVHFGVEGDKAKQAPLPISSATAELKIGNGTLWKTQSWLTFPQEFNIEGDFPYDNLIVGWSMVSNKSSNGRWQMEAKWPVVGQRSRLVIAYSDNAHDLDWIWTVYYVPMSLFPWVTDVPMGRVDATAVA